MITHRNAYMNIVGTLLHLPMQMTDRYLWTLPATGKIQKFVLRGRYEPQH